MPYFFASTSVANLSSFVASSSPPPPVPKSTLHKGRYKAKAKPPPNPMPVVSAQQTPSSYSTSSSPTSYHKSRPTCTVSLAHAHVDVASFAQGHISAPSLSSLTMPAPPAPNLPDRSELQSPIQEDRAHRAFRFPVSAKPAGEGTSFRGNAMNNGKGKRKGGAVGRVATNCIPFPTTTILGGTPPSPTSSTTTTTSYSRSAASSTTSVSTCSSTASLELKLASFPAPPSTPPHVLLRVRQAQSQPKPSPASRARKLSGLPKATMHKPKSTTKTTPPPVQARSLLTLAAALGKATAPRMSASVSVPPASTKRADIPRLVRRGLVDDRDGMERPGSPIPRSRGERRRSVLDESEHEDEDDAKQKQKKKEDEEADLKSALTFEPPPYSAPPPPYSPTVSPPPVVTAAEPRVLPTPPVEEIQIHAPVPKPVYVPPPQSSSSQPTATRRGPARVSASEIRVLLTLYRTVMVGLEKRYRAAEEATAKAHGEKVNGKEKAKARFPLVEDDDEMEGQPFWVVDDTEEEEEEEEKENVNDEEEEYIPRRRPPPTRAPPNSPVGSPPSSGVYVRPLPASKSVHQEPAPAQSQKNTAELDVQDALLAIRLRGFLKAQGVSEAELDVVFDEVEEDEEGEDDETMAAEIDRALAEMHAASAAAAAEKPNKAEAMAVETSASPTEEGMHALPPPPRPRSCTGPVEKRPLRSSPSPPLELNKSAPRNVIGGRTTSPSPPPSASYMIALLTMRHRYASRRSAAASKGYPSVGYPTWRRSSALKSVAWVARLDEEDEEGQSANGNGMEVIREQEEEEDGEMDVDSVVDLYAGMC